GGHFLRQVPRLVAIGLFFLAPAGRFAREPDSEDQADTQHSGAVHRWTLLGEVWQCNFGEPSFALPDCYSASSPRFLARHLSSSTPRHPRGGHVASTLPQRGAG